MATIYKDSAIHNIVYNGKTAERLCYNCQQNDLNCKTPFFSDNSLIGQTELNYECGIGEAKVNLRTGRLLFKHNDLSIGTGNFQINISHVYNSKWIESKERLPHFAGTGWKVNIQQYCYPYSENEIASETGFNNGDYVYIDADGYRHRFIKYKEKENELYYYDESGSLLVLKKKIDNTLEITSQTGDVIVFNEKGVAVSFISGKNKNQNIKKVITYNNGLIDTIYDARKTYRYIKFCYNNVGLLSEIICYENNSIKKKLNYLYDDNNCLIEIQATAKNKTKSIVFFSYENDKLSLAVDAESKSAIGISYMLCDNTYNVSKINVGFADVSNKKEISLLDNKEKQDISFYYTFYETTVIEKGISLLYQFNGRGFTSAVFEKEGQNYRTLTKKKGWSLWEDGNTDIKINGKKSFKSYNNVFEINQNKIKELTALFDSEDDKYLYCNAFKLTFWVKLNKQVSNDVKAKLKITTFDGKYIDLTYDNFLDNSACNVWQQVSIPISFEWIEAEYPGKTKKYESYYFEYDISRRKRQITKMILEFAGIPNGDPIDICDMQINIENTERILIRDKYLNYMSYIYYEDNEHYKSYEDIGSKFFMTKNDLILTNQNFSARKNNNSEYDLVICNGTKRLSVTKAQLSYHDADDEVVDITDIGFSEKNTVFETKIRNGKKTWLVNKVYYSFYTDYYVRYFAIDNRSDFYTQNSDDETETYESYYYNGLKKETKDAYGVITKYIYDDYGNLERIETFNENNPDKKLTKTFVYNTSENKSREVVTAVSESGIEQQVSFESPFFNQLTETVVNGDPPLYTKCNDYDEFKEKILRVHTTTGDGDLSCNTLSYDENGYVSEVYDTFGNHYRFEYDLLKNSTSYISLYEDGTQCELLKIEYSYDTDNHSCTITETYLPLLDTNTIISTFDKFDRIISVSEGNNKIEFKYQTIEESHTLEEISEIKDPYTKQRYIYKYDELENNLSELTFVSENGGETKGLIIQYKQNNTKYIFKNGSKETIRDFACVYEDSEVEKGNKIYINPRLRKTIDFEEDSESKDYYFYYGYDELGRLVKEKNDDGNFICDYTYNDYGRVTQIKFDKSNCYFQYTYDSLGNIKTIKENLDNSNNIEYSYDSLNRLVYEKNKILNISREYVYNANGLCSKIYNNGVIEKTYNYDKNNRLLRINFNDCQYKYSYDLGGRVNKITISDNFTTTEYPLSWERGNLLKQYADWNYSYNYQGIRYKKVNRITGFTKFYYLDGEKILGEDWSDNTKIRYFYNATGIIGFSYNGENYHYIKDLQQNIRAIVKGCDIICTYDYDSLGHVRISSRGDKVATINPFRWKSYYYDEESNLYLIASRYYCPECGRFLNPADVTNLDSTCINGLDLYTYANNNPIYTIYDFNSNQSLCCESALESFAKSPFSIKRLNLPKIPWIIDNGTTIYGIYSSLSTGIPIFTHYAKYAKIINYEFKLYGISKWNTSLQLSNVNLKTTGFDAFLIGLDSLIDMYDSYQRGVSTRGILLGGVLTAASDIGLLYLNKGIIWASTTIGTALCPGLGTAIGFGIGLFISILTDIFLGQWIRNWIDKIIK